MSIDANTEELQRDLRDRVKAGLAASVEAEREGYAVEEVYWGYIIKSRRAHAGLVEFFQGMAWLFGIACIIATLGLWVLPEALTHGSVIGMKVAMSAVTMALGVFFLWFASRGVESEVQVDTRLAEVREVVRNRAGRANLIARHGFDSIGDVALLHADETKSGQSAALELQHRSEAFSVRVASGSVGGLAMLQSRLNNDLMLQAREGFNSPYDADGGLIAA